MSELCIMLLIFSLFRGQCLVFIMENRRIITATCKQLPESLVTNELQIQRLKKSLYRKIWKSVACEQAFRRACSQARKSDEVKCYGHAIHVELE